MESVRISLAASHDSSSPDVSGRRLCFALRMAGLATSSGLARESGCPGGAFGLRMLSKIGLAVFFDFCGELFLAIFSLHSCCLERSRCYRCPVQVSNKTSRKTDPGLWEERPERTCNSRLTTSGRARLHCHAASSRGFSAHSWSQHGGAAGTR